MKRTAGAFLRQSHAHRLLCLLFLSWSAACGDGTSDGFDRDGGLPSLPSFVFVVSQLDLTAQVSTSPSVRFYVRCDGTTPDAVPIAVSGLPEGVTASAINTTADGDGSFTLTIAEDVDLGSDATLDVAATCAGATITRSISLYLHGPPTYALMFDDEIVDTRDEVLELPFNNRAFDLTVLREGGFLETVEFSFSALPAGISVLTEYLPSTENPHGGLVFVGSFDDGVGDYDVTMTATSSVTAIVRTITFHFHVEQGPAFDHGYAFAPLREPAVAPGDPGSPTHGVAGVVFGSSLFILSSVTPAGHGPHALVTKHDRVTGARDTTFGVDGFAALPELRVGNALALAGDGGVLVAGTDVGAGPQSAFVARFTDAGVLDTDFGSSGYMAYPMGMGSIATTLLVIEGTYYVGGNVVSAGGDDTVFMRRGNAVTGVDDVAYGINFEVPGISYSLSASVLTDSLYFAGRTIVGGDQSAFVVRLDPVTGLPDQTFGSGGIQTHPMIGDVQSIDATGPDAYYVTPSTALHPVCELLGGEQPQIVDFGTLPGYPVGVSPSTFGTARTAPGLFVFGSYDFGDHYEVFVERRDPLDGRGIGFNGSGLTSVVLSTMGEQSWRGIAKGAGEIFLIGTNDEIADENNPGNGYAPTTRVLRFTY